MQFQFFNFFRSDDRRGSQGPAVRKQKPKNRELTFDSLEERLVMTIPATLAVPAAATVIENSSSSASGLRQNPHTAMSDDGRSVTVWSGAGSGDSSGIYFRLNDANSTPLGVEVNVNQTTTGTQSNAAVAVNDNFTVFAVVWTSPDAAGNGIFARIFDGSGNALTNQFQVNTTTTGDQFDASVAMNANGSFVVTWTSSGQEGAGNSTFGVYGRGFTSSGAAASSEFRVNTFTAGDQQKSSVSMTSGNNFVVAWESGGQVGNSFNIYAQQYSAPGAAIGSEFRVSNGTVGNKTHADVSISRSSGNFVIVWQGDNEADDPAGSIRAKIYGAGGTLLKDEFRVNSFTPLAQINPVVAMDRGGDFVVAWQSFNQSSAETQWGIYSQAFNADGTTSGNQANPSTNYGANYVVRPTPNFPSITPDVAFSSVKNWFVVWDAAFTIQTVNNQYRATISSEIPGLLYGNAPPTAPQGVTQSTTRAEDFGTFDFPLPLTNATTPNSAYFSDSTGTPLTFAVSNITNPSLYTITIVNNTTVRITSVLNANGVGSFDIRATDIYGASKVVTFNVTVTAVNDAPTVTVPAAQSTNSTTDVVFSSTNGTQIIVNDVDDLGATNFQVTLSAFRTDLTTTDYGTLTIPAGNQTTFLANGGTIVFTPGAPSTYLLTGTRNAINDLIDGLIYTPPATFQTPITGQVSGIGAGANAGNGANAGYYTATVRTFANDNGNTGSGGPMTGTGTVVVNPVNVAPVVSAPATQTTDENTGSLAAPSNVLTFNYLAPITLTDTDNNSGIEMLTLSTTAGNVMRLTANTYAAIVTALPNSVFTSATGANGSWVLAASAAASGQFLRVFGTIAQLNAALVVAGDATYGAELITGSHVTGTVTVTAVLNDQQNSGVGNNTSTQNISVTVNGVNEPVTVSVNPTNVQFVQGNGALTLGSLGGGTLFTVSDQDVAFNQQTNYNGSSMTVTLSDGIAEDVLAVGNGGSVTVSGTSVFVSGVMIGTVNTTSVTGTGTLSFSFNGFATLTRIQSLLNSITYNNSSFTPNTSFDRDVTVTFTDVGGFPNPGTNVQNTSTTFTNLLTVIDGDDPAYIQLNGVIQTNGQTISVGSTLESSPFAFTGATGIQVMDPDAGVNNIQVTITSVNGTVNVGADTGTASVTGGARNSASLTITGSQTDINTMLNSLAYTPNIGYFGNNASVTVSTNDLGNDLALPGGPRTYTNTFAIVVIEVPPPRIIALSVSSGTTTYTIPVGSGVQLNALPWTGINRINIQFNTGVNTATLGGALQATGLQRVGNGSVQVDYGAVYSSYNATTNTATYNLTTAVGIGDKILLVLDDTVTNNQAVAPDALDGEWTNPVTTTSTGSSTVSGNGVAGGDFVFRFNTLGGDVNGDGKITASDLATIAQVSRANAYFLQADVNLDGAVNMTDYNLANSVMYGTLPVGVPAGVTGDVLSASTTSNGSASAGSIPTNQPAVNLSAAEQYFLELVNQARLDPAGTAARLGVDLNAGLAPGTISSDPVQALASLSSLYAAMSGHTQDMINRDYFSHTGMNGSTIETRAQAAGLTSYIELAENLAWRGTTGQLTDPTAFINKMFSDLFIDHTVAGRGHRLNLLDGDFNAVGTAITNGVFSKGGLDYNALMAGQTYAAIPGSFLTGVIYNDSQKVNNFYDIGEGIGGVSVAAVSTSGITYYTSTGSSGGYSLQIPDGSYTVTFAGGGLSSPAVYANVSVSGRNVKLDWNPHSTSGPISPSTPPLEAPVVTPTPVTLPFADSFNRANAYGLGSYWEAQGGKFMVSNGSAVAVAPTGTLSSAALVDAEVADISLSADIDVTGTPGWGTGLFARQTSSGSYWASVIMRNGTPSLEIWRSLNGVSTALSSQVISGSSGKLEFDVAGSSLKAYWNGQLVSSVTDNSLSVPGEAGIRAFHGKIDNFSAETIAPPQQSTPTVTNVSLPFSDEFARANANNLGSNWISETGQFNVSSGTAVAAASSGTLSNSALAGVNVADVSLSADIDIMGTPGWGTGLFLRQTSSGSYWASVIMRGNTPTLEIWRNYNGTSTALSSKTISGASGNLVFDAFGSSLKVYWNGQLMSSVTDTALSGAGEAGVRAFFGKIDNFSAQTTSQAPQQTAPVVTNVTLPFTDDFARTNAPNLGSNWVSEAGQFTLSDGVAAASSGTSGALSSSALAGVNVANVTLSANVDVTGTPGWGTGLFVRQSSSGSYWASIIMRNGTPTLEIWRSYNGTSTAISSQAISGASGKLTFDAFGSSLKTYWNDQLVSSVTDSTLTGTGGVGIRAFFGKIDNFSAQTTASQAAEQPILSPLATFTDTFTRADSAALGPNWTAESGSLHVANGLAVATPAALSESAISGTSATDVSLKAHIDVTGTPGWGTGLFARKSSDGMYWAAVIMRNGTPTVEVWRNDHGNWQALSSNAVAGAEGNLQFDVFGDTLTVYWNDAQVAKINDSAVASAGEAGIRALHGTIDNFSAYVSPLTTIEGSFTVQGEMVVADSSFDVVSEAETTAVTSPDVSQKATVDVSKNGEFIGLSARTSSDGLSGYAGVIYNNGGVLTVAILKSVNDTGTVLGTAQVTGSIGELKFDVVGDSLKVSWKGQQVLSVSDSSIANGGASGLGAHGGRYRDYTIQVASAFVKAVKANTATEEVNAIVQATISTIELSSPASALHMQESLVSLLELGAIPQGTSAVAIDGGLAVAAAANAIKPAVAGLSWQHHDGAIVAPLLVDFPLEDETADQPLMMEESTSIEADGAVAIGAVAGLAVLSSHSLRRRRTPSGEA